ncbi:MAG TPA: tRNA epoxyqueuosine(34) reductase QueG [Longimicrobiales bacterium]
MERTASDLAARLKARALELGFDRAGIAAVKPSEHAAFYRAWLAAGRHGTMHYLARPDAVERRLDPQAAWPELRSALVVAQHYDPEGDDDAAADPARAVVARYARGRDYHKVIKPKLLSLLRWLEAEVGRELPAARAYVDTGPVLERELARRAGLGWFGRNTMLIHPRRGSYFFIGTLLVEVELEPDAPFEEDRCGTCNACVDACPTGALLGRDADGAPVIDATRCISYLTIELRGPIPRELRPLIGNRVFGCDVCQEVCPWNSEKFVGIGVRGDARARAGDSPARLLGGSDSASGSDSGRHAPGTGAGTLTGAGTELRLVDLMGMDEAAWDAFSRGSAIRRAKRAGFLRNVAVALGNWGAPEAVPALVRALEDPEPLVRGHAAWALGRIGSAGAREALISAVQRERDPFVLEELDAALASCGSSEE